MSDISSSQAPWIRPISAAIASCGAEVFTLPLEVCKIRMQTSSNRRDNTIISTKQRRISSSASAQSWKKRSTSSTGFPSTSQKVLDLRGPSRMFSFQSLGLLNGENSTASHSMKPNYAGNQRQTISTLFLDILRNEGPNSFFRGLKPACIRQVVMQPTKLAFYEPIRDSIPDISGHHAHTSQEAPVWKMALAGGISGGIAAIVGNPADLIKTRMQAAATTGPMTSVPYNGSVLEAVKTISHTEAVEVTTRWAPKSMGNILALFRGVGPNVQRNFIVNAVELGAYDFTKQQLVCTFVEPHRSSLAKPAEAASELSEWYHYLFSAGERSTVVHLGAATVAGITSATVVSPIDLAKNVMMNQERQGTGTGTDTNSSRQRGMAKILYDIYQKEGPRGWFRGYVPAVCRITPWAMIMFTTYEQIKNSLVDITES